MDDREVLELLIETKCPSTRRRLALELYHRLMEARCRLHENTSLSSVALTSLLTAADDWMQKPKPSSRRRHSRVPMGELVTPETSDTEVENK